MIQSLTYRITAARRGRAGGAKRRAALLPFLAALSLAGADLELAPGAPSAVFGGATRPVPLTFRNRTNRALVVPVRLQLLQASSATVAPLGPATEWKQLTLPPHQTILEQAPVSLPEVRGPTRFLLRIMERDSVLGTPEIWAYPSNQLAELNALLDGGALVLAGAPAEWPELLTATGVRVNDWSDARPPLSSVKLAVVGPGMVPPGAEGNLVSQFSKAGVGVIWIQPLKWPEAGIAPAYFSVATDKAAVVVAQADSLTNLSTDPWTQLRLLRMVRLAMGRERPALPRTVN